MTINIAILKIYKISKELLQEKTKNLFINSFISVVKPKTVGFLVEKRWVHFVFRKREIQLSQPNKPTYLGYNPSTLHSD